MIYYYVVVDFYPDLNKANEYEEAMIPYHTFEEACDAIDKTMDLYEENDELGAYECWWMPDTKSTVAFITIKDNGIIRAFRFEVCEAQLEIIKTK